MILVDAAADTHLVSTGSQYHHQKHHLINIHGLLNIQKSNAIINL